MRTRLWILLLVALLCCAPCAADDATQPFGAGDAWPPHVETPVDLHQVPWAQEAIVSLMRRGLIHAEGGYFYPGRAITRGEFTKLFIGLAGLYQPGAACTFADVPADDPYYGYIASAYTLGIVKGFSDRWFARNSFLTREDLAVLLYRAGAFAEVTFENRPMLTFEDTAAIADYATEAVSALVGAQAIAGDGANRFAPKNYATRAEACKVVYYLLLKSI